MSEHVASSMRTTNQVAQTVRIKLRDADFTTLTRQVRLDQPTDQGQQVHAAAAALFKRHWKGRPLRLLGVGVSGLLDGAGYQLDLFDDLDQRRARLDRTLDKIRDRFGYDVIQRASLAKREPRPIPVENDETRPPAEPEPGSRKPPHS